ncbi:MAG: hypothetical protein ACYCYO_06150 [Bacilli bacterium]
MKSVLALARLEYSRHERWALLPRKQGRIPYTALIVIATVALGVTLFDSLLIKKLGQMQEWIYVWGIAWVFCVMVFQWVITFVVLQTPEQDWWLSFPHPRLQLMLGKSLATVAISARIGATLAIGLALAHTVLAVVYQAPVGVSLGQFGYGLLVCLSVVILLPFAIGFSSLAVVVAKGWLRILALLHAVVMYALSFIAIMGGIAAATPGTTGAFGFPNLTSTQVLLRALPWFLLGWPLALVCLALTPWGLTRLGDARFPNAGSPSYRNDGAGKLIRGGARRSARQQLEWASGQQSEFPERPHRPYAALFRLELTRYRWLSRSANRFASAAAYTWLFLMFVAGFFIELSNLAMFLVPMFVSWLIMFGLYSYSVNLRLWDRNRGYLPWLLSFPLTRWKMLVVERLAALYAMILANLLSLAACAVGFLLHAMFTPIPRETGLTLMLLGQVDLLLFVTGVFGLGLTSCYAWIIAHPSRVILWLPLTYAPVIVFFYVNSLWTGQNGNSLPAALVDYGFVLAWIIGIGLPLAVWGIWIGARYQHIYMQLAPAKFRFQSGR